MTETLEVTTLRPTAGLSTADSAEHARAGAAGIGHEMSGSPVHATIDHSTVDWKLTTVVHRVEDC